jgi:hypothetical protein
VSELTHRVGHRRYRRSYKDSISPRPEQFLGDSCPGNGEGQFGDAVADFPVR